MTWSKFGIGFLLVVLLTYAKAQFTSLWVPLEFSFFLIFYIIRKAEPNRALVFVFLLSVGLDFLLQTAQIKGLTAMGQLLMVYLISHLKRYIVPFYEDFFMLACFALFYMGNYYLGRALSKVFGVFYETISFRNLAFFTLIHVTLFAGMLLVQLRFARSEP